jgi:uncharacterized protein (DUF58 family)
MTARTLIPDLQRFARVGHTDRQGTITIAPRQVYILPTRYGLLYTLLVVVILIASINSASNLGFLTGFFLASIGLVSMVLTWWNLAGLRITPLSTEPVFAGNPAHFMLRLHNERKRSRPGIAVSSASGKTAGSVADIDGNNDSTLGIRLPAQQRGILRAGRIRLHTDYPLGLFHAWCYLETGQQCIVFPSPAKEVTRLMTPDESGTESGDFGRGADDFIGHRYYRDGDPLQHVDWKIAARERGLYCKLFGGNKADQLCLDWDALPDVGTEARLRLLSRSILDASEMRMDYSLRLPGKEIEPSRGKQHELQCLTALALYGLDGNE